MMMDGTDLTPCEEKALNEFLTIVNQSRIQNAERQMRPNTARKFLMARKFDVNRSLQLYQSHEHIRIREGLVKFDPLQDPLKRELETGKFTILPVPDESGSKIALFSACKHVPAETSHQTTLQGVVYQMDVALDDYKTQRSGIIFIYNMSGSKYSNFDYELSQKILSLLKGAYPARLRKVLIVTAPLWFKAPFRILQLFIREKLRDRVHMVNLSQLQHHIPAELIPEELGGPLKIDHQSWLDKCLEIHKTDMGDLCPNVACTKALYSTSPTSSAGSSVNSSPVGTLKGADKHLFTDPTTLINGCCSSSVVKDNLTNQPPEPTTTNGVCDSFLEQYTEIEDGVEGFTLEEFIEKLNKGRNALFEEYDQIRRMPPAGTFEHSQRKSNHSKNRYTNVLSYDHSTVKLPLLENDSDSDYINANYVDGYRQKRAFISTQGPLTKTFLDFWRCVWFNKSLVIVMTTRTMERGHVKCGQYWPLEEKTYCQIGNFCIVNNSVEQDKDWMITHLDITNTDTEEKRTVIHMQFTSWPDFGVPQSAIAMLEFRRKVRDFQKEYLKRISWKGHPLGPPIIVHCSAGIGRTGTFITIDISIQRLEARGRIDIFRTVEKIREQRAYSIQTHDQYVFCWLALFEFAICQGLLQNTDLTRFDEADPIDGN